MTRVSDFNAAKLTRVETRLDDLTTEFRSLRTAQAVEAEKAAGRDLALAGVRSDVVRILEKLERIAARLEIGS